MPRRVAATVLTLLLWPAFTAGAQSWRSGVDPRIELMSILFRLAGNGEYNQCRIPAYDKAVESWFAPYRSHEAVRLAHSLGIGYEAPMKLAAYVADANSLAERVPFDGPGIHLYAGWDAGKARAFLKAARAFVADAKFRDFLQSQQPLYAATNGRLRAFVETSADLLWFSRFFGASAPGRFVIVPGMANGSPSYAVYFRDPGGAEEIYAIPGVWSVDARAIPVFNADWRNTMAREFLHAYCGPVVDKFAPRMEKAARQIYETAGESMPRQTNGSWKTLLHESLVRAVAVRYALDHDGADAARKVVRQEIAHSFFWTGDLSDLLGEYQNNRQSYPALESFMPRVAQFFDDVAPRVGDLAARYQPRVISISPPDGAQDVDPSLREVVVRFSIPMSRSEATQIPRIFGPRFDETGTALTIPIVLEPDRDYQTPLRWPDGQSFLSADGVPLPAATVHFRTRAASPPAPQ